MNKLEYSNIRNYVNDLDNILKLISKRREENLIWHAKLNPNYVFYNMRLNQILAYECISVRI